MLSFALVSALSSLQDQNIIEKNCKVYEFKGCRELVNRTTGDGFAYSDDKNVFLVDANGKVEKTLPLESGNIPIAVDQKEELIQVNRRPVTTEAAGLLVFSRFLSVGGTLAIETTGLSLLSQKHWSLDSIGSFDGLGINIKQDRILHIDSSGNVPFLKKYEYVNYVWKQIGESVVPLVSDGDGGAVGWAVPQNRFSDIVFLNQNYAAFIGGLDFSAGDDIVEKFVNGLVSFPSFRMEAPLTDQETSRVIFIIDIRSGYCEGYGLVKIDGSGGRGSLGFSRMIVSGSEKYLYLSGDGKVLQVPVEHVLESVGFAKASDSK